MWGESNITVIVCDMEGHVILSRSIKEVVDPVEASHQLILAHDSMGLVTDHTVGSVGVGAGECAHGSVGQRKRLASFPFRRVSQRSFIAHLQSNLKLCPHCTF